MKLFLAFIFIVSPIFLIDVLACQCRSLPSVWSAFDRSSAVFVGKAVKSNLKESSAFEEYEKLSDEDMIYEFEVVNSFKGVKNNTVKINLGEPNMCEFGFQIGETYLIYANGKNEQNLYTGTFCSRIEKLKNAEDQIHFINEKLNGKTEPQIYGSVVLTVNEQQNWKRSFVPNYKFFIEDGKKKIGIKTDKNGIFNINNLKKGIYSLFFEENDNYKTEYYFSTKFRIFENGMAVIIDESLPFNTETISDEEFEEFINYPLEKLGFSISRGVYFEIELNERSSK